LETAEKCEAILKRLLEIAVQHGEVRLGVSPLHREEVARMTWNQKVEFLYALVRRQTAPEGDG